MKRFIHKLFKSPHFLVIAGGNFAAMLSFLANILLTRNLIPEESAKFFAISAVPPIAYSIFSFVTYKIGSIVVEEVNENPTQLILKRTSDNFYIYSTILSFWTGLLLLLSVPISIFLKLEDFFPLSILLLFLFFSAEINFFSGILQGKGNFFFLGLKDIGLGVVKILSLCLLFYGFGIRSVWAAIFSEGISILLIFLVLFRYCRQFILPFNLISKLNFNFKEYVSFFSSSLGIIGGVALIGFVTSFDILISKNLLPAAEAGYLIAASTLSKIVFFTCGSVPMIVYIFALRHRINKDKKQNLKSLIFSFLLVLGIGIGVSVILYICNEFLVSKIYGQTYLPVVTMVPGMLTYMLAVSLCILIINFLMAQEWLKPMWILAISYSAFVIWHLIEGVPGATNLTFRLAFLSGINLCALVFATIYHFSRQ